MKIMFLLVTSGLVLTSCASGRIRENCQTHNWQKRGMDLARQGKTIDQDYFTKRCEAVGGFVNYAGLDRGFKAARDEICDPKKALADGKSGTKFNYPICHSHNYENMQSAYNLGLKSFCNPQNGQRFGASGQEYQGNCPPDLEASFLSNYQSGRKQYLENQLAINTSKLKATKVEIDKKLAYKNGLLQKLSRHNNPDTRSELDTVSWDINHLSAEKSKLEYEIRKIQDSLAKL